VLDPAGEWHVKNTTFMESATLAGIQVVMVHGKSDKRMNSRAEGSILKLKHMVQAGLLDRRLDASWWQRRCDYAWVVNNLYPLQRNAASGPHSSKLKSFGRGGDCVVTFCGMK
jgi:hypothetical protein